jgi:hypothetical protein
MACETAFTPTERVVGAVSGNSILRVLSLQESPKAMAQEIALYGSGLGTEESSGNPGASILKNGRHELRLSGSSIIGRWILVACAEYAAAVIWV